MERCEMVNAKLKYSAKFASHPSEPFDLDAGTIIRVPKSTFDSMSTPTVHGGGWQVSFQTAMHIDSGASNIFSIHVDRD